MNIEQLRTYCLSKQNATEDFPFDSDTLVFKVLGKMFALVPLKNWELGQPSLNLKCDPEEAFMLRDIFPSVIPGYHMNKTHWNTIILDGSIPQGEIERMMDNSFRLVVNKMTKTDQLSLLSI